MGIRARDVATAILAPGPLLLAAFVAVALVAERDVVDNLAIFAPAPLAAFVAAHRLRAASWPVRLGCAAAAFAWTAGVLVVAAVVALLVACGDHGCFY